jgi:hypothetical protein
MVSIRCFDFRDGCAPGILVFMQNTRFAFAVAVVLALLLVLAGCSGSHVAPPIDAGVLSDAAPVDAARPPEDAASARDAFVAPSGCRLAMPGVAPTPVGEGCFCDGPFAVRGDFAYRLSFMLEVIDLGDPDHPVLVTSVAEEARYSSDVEIVGDVLFAAGGALERFDLTDPRAPVSLGVVDLGGEATALAVDGARLVVAILREDMTHAVLAIDATDPRALVIGAPIELDANEASALALDGGIAFAVLQDATTAASTFASIDLEGATIADTLPLAPGSSLSAIVAHAGHVFISHLGDGVTLVDATDPAALADLGRIALDATTVFSLGLTGDRLIVLGGGGVWLYDASIPRALVPLGSADWAFDVGHGELFGTHLLVSGGNALVSLPLVCD